MFQVMYRLEGNGAWSSWFLPSTVQAANGQVRNLQKDERIVAVEVAPAGVARASVDLKV